MLIVPEIQTVFILTPRTGSGTLYRAAREKYPRSMLLYRHMEADGCPQGYDMWRRVGFVRHPTVRLWSLYNFMKTWDRSGLMTHSTEEQKRVYAQVARPFEDWLINNTETWTAPRCLSGTGSEWPQLARRDPAPENKRSQFSYLRPDLGVTIHKYEDIADVFPTYGLPTDSRHNKSEKPVMPALSPAAQAHIETFCAWDLSLGCKEV